MTRKWILNLVRVYVQMNKIVVQWNTRTHLSAELNTYPSNLLATFYGGGFFQIAQLFIYMDRIKKTSWFEMTRITYLFRTSNEEENHFDAAVA